MRSEQRDGKWVVAHTHTHTHSLTHTHTHNTTRYEGARWTIMSPNNMAQEP